MWASHSSDSLEGRSVSVCIFVPKASGSTEIVSYSNQNHDQLCVAAKVGEQGRNGMASSYDIAIHLDAAHSIPEDIVEPN